MLFKFYDNYLSLLIFIYSPYFFCLFFLCSYLFCSLNVSNKLFIKRKNKRKGGNLKQVSLYDKLSLKFLVKDTDFLLCTHFSLDPGYCV